MKSEILVSIPSLTIGLLLIIASFLLADDLIIIIGFLFLGTIISLEGLTTLFECMYYKTCPYCLSTIKKSETFCKCCQHSI